MTQDKTVFFRQISYILDIFWGYDSHFLTALEVDLYQIHISRRGYFDFQMGLAPNLQPS
ncbi:MAG: hypothetical protein AB7E63_03790 [Parachlamydia sp.]|nr:hypothetical protein pah_c026o036 [Parachlamydia acanthamoebae str. Hall's coccus]